MDPISPTKLEQGKYGLNSPWQRKIDNEKKVVVATAAITSFSPEVEEVKLIEA